jgi:hypothetical protein
MLNTTNQYLKYNTGIFKNCYDLWNSPHYAAVHKSCFFSQNADNHRIKTKMLIDFLKTFKFDVQVIQVLGASKDTEKNANYDESFLNMLQRFDIEKSVKFFMPNARTKVNAMFSVKGTHLQLSILEVLVQSIWTDAVMEMDEH